MHNPKTSLTNIMPSLVNLNCNLVGIFTLHNDKMNEKLHVH